jgi:hypothetical protein
MASQQSILAPKSDANEQPCKKLVPKKSKLGILISVETRTFPMSSVASVPLFQLLVVEASRFMSILCVDPDVGEIEASQPLTKENPAMLKTKTDEGRRWWTIGQGRKKEKEKGKENKISTSTKRMSISLILLRC